jgi:RNA polymerase sigma factor (TIGR02999 family)
MAGSVEVTTLLTDARRGDDAATDRLFALVYDELREMARRQLRHEREGHTLNPTALVHEAYLKLVGGAGAFEDRSHFLAVAARAMRQVLIDHARARHAKKRSGSKVRVAFDEERVHGGHDESMLIALDDALTALSDLSPRLARVVEFRYFAGLTENEIASALDLSVRTVQRDWRKARAWLSRELADSPPR